MHFLLADDSLWTLGLALVLGVVQTRHDWRVGRFAESSLIWIAFWVLGVGGVYNFILHIAFGPFIAEQIGWPNSPFQNEVAYANLMMGVLGFSSFWYRKRDYLLAAMCAYSSWFFADGVGHVFSIVTANDVAQANAGIVLYTDLLTPVLVIFFVWLSRQERHWLR